MFLCIVIRRDEVLAVWGTDYGIRSEYWTLQRTGPIDGRDVL